MVSFRLPCALGKVELCGWDYLGEAVQEVCVVGSSQLWASIVAVIFTICGEESYFVDLDFRKLLFLFLFILEC